MNKLFLFLLPLLLWACQPPEQQTNPDRQNAPEQQTKPYVVMVSLDGFRYDYAEKYQAPNLLRLAREGVSAEKMLPSYPSKTFPNHYTLVTGLYPAHHGLVSNTFYDDDKAALYQIRDREKVEDGSWYGGTPLWVLAEQNDLLAASYFWVGSEADVQGIRPTYWYPYDGSVPHEKRVAQVIEWLQLPPETRPHLITCYFSVVDSRGHRRGPEADEVREAVLEVDRRIGQLDSAFQALGLPVTLVVVSDHGMLAVNEDDPVILSRLVDLDGWEVAYGSTQVLLYHEDSSAVPQMYAALQARTEKHPIRVFYPEELPEHLHFTGTPRVGDIVVETVPPYVFGRWGMPVSTGTHGYDPREVPEMGAIFYAKGPQLPADTVLPTFENIHVYPLVAALLGLPLPEGLDADPEVLVPLISDH